MQTNMVEATPTLIQIRTKDVEAKPTCLVPANCIDPPMVLDAPTCLNTINQNTLVTSTSILNTDSSKFISAPIHTSEALVNANATTSCSALTNDMDSKFVTAMPTSSARANHVDKKIVKTTPIYASMHNHVI